MKREASKTQPATQRTHYEIRCRLWLEFAGTTLSVHVVAVPLTVICCTCSYCCLSDPTHPTVSEACTQRFVQRGVRDMFHTMLSNLR